MLLFSNKINVKGCVFMESCMKEKLIEFITPYYFNKDIMHNMWHIELVLKYVQKIISQGNYRIDCDSILYAVYFHGFIYTDEATIREWLKEQDIAPDKIDFIVKIAWESQKPENPQTLEGKILHDAHVIEGGKEYLLTKCLITGSVKGQTLLETIDFIEKNVIDNNKCYLPETISVCNRANEFTKEFIQILKKDIF